MKLKNLITGLWFHSWMTEGGFNTCLAQMIIKVLERLPRNGPIRRHLWTQMWTQQYVPLSDLSPVLSPLSSVRCPPLSGSDQREQEELCSVFWFSGLAGQQAGAPGGVLW